MTKRTRLVMITAGCFAAAFILIIFGALLPPADSLKVIELGASLAVSAALFVIVYHILEIMGRSFQFTDYSSAV